MVIRLRTWPGTVGQKFFSKSNFGQNVRPDIWMGQMSGHSNVRSRAQIGTWDILTKFDLEKKFCSSVPGHVLSRITKSRGCLIEIVRARPVLGNVPSKCPAGRTFKCPSQDGHPNVRSRAQIWTWDILAKFDLEKNFCSSVPGHVPSRMTKSRGCLI